VIDAHVRANSNPESAGELCAAVGDEIILHVELADNVFRKHACQFWLVDVLPAGEVDRHLSQSGNDYHNPSACRSR